MEIRDTRNGEWHWVNDAVVACKHITHAEKSVYSALTTFAGCSEIHPNFKTIAERANVSERWAKLSVKHLIEVGYIGVKKGGGRGHSNVYTLLKAHKGCRLCTLSKGGTKLQERVNKVPIKGEQNTPQIDKELDKEINKVSSVDDKGSEFSIKQEITKLNESSRKDFKIISHYLKEKNLNFDNHDQYITYFKRCLKAAKDLKGYNADQVQKTINHCRANYDEWTLETVAKRIIHVINQS